MRSRRLRRPRVASARAIHALGRHSCPPNGEGHEWAGMVRLEDPTYFNAIAGPTLAVRYRFLAVFFADARLGFRRAGAFFFLAAFGAARFATA